MLSSVCSFDRDKKKEFASNSAAFYPFGVDLFLSQRKIDHIARFVELPVFNLSEEIPSILVVNIQVLVPSHFYLRFPQNLLPMVVCMFS